MPVRLRPMTEADLPQLTNADSPYESFGPRGPRTGVLDQKGVTRGAQWREGAHRDGYLSSILRSDWEATR